MLVLRIFVQIQTFRQMPFVPSHNFCHPGEGNDDDYSEKLILTIRVLGLLNVNANRQTQLNSTTNAHRPITSLC